MACLVLKAMSEMEVMRQTKSESLIKRMESNLNWEKMNLLMFYWGKKETFDDKHIQCTFHSFFFKFLIPNKVQRRSGEYKGKRIRTHSDVGGGGGGMGERERDRERK